MAVTRRTPYTKGGKNPRRGYKPRSTAIKRKAKITRRRTPPRFNINPYPKNKLARHRYVENITIPAAGGAGQTRQYVFKANGIFDPNTTGTGHQPMFRDEMAAVYTYYTVIASYIKVTLNQAAVNQENWGIICTQDDSLSSDPTTVLEQYGGHTAALMTNRNSPKILRSSYDAKKKNKTTFQGLMADDTQRNTVGTDASTKVAYNYIIWSGPIDATVTVPSQKVQVEIIYIVMWREAKDAVQS